LFRAVASLAAGPVAKAHAESEGAGLPQFDPSSWPSQLFWLFVFFGGLYLLMAKYFLPRIGATIEERRDRIADDLDKASELKKDADAAEKAYAKALADATAKAQAIAAETRAKLAGEIAEMSAEADAKAAQAVAAAEARIAAMKTDASKKVREAAIETARAVVAILIDETPTTEAATAALPARVDA
jgi:F-type H+-transporting ATPase subunit b